MNVYLAERPAWQEEAACRGMDVSIFFEHGIEGGGTTPEGVARRAEALATCESCPVQAECRDYAMTHERFGIWGGLTERQRKRSRPRRGRGNHNTALTAQQQAWVRRLAERGWQARDLACRYSVNVRTIYRALEAS